MAGSILCLMQILFNGAGGYGQNLPQLDFHTNSDELWKPTHDLARVTISEEGARFESTGSDPYSIGPRVDFPDGQPLFLDITLKSEAGGSAQLFYFTDAAREENSIRFSTVAGEWVTHRLALPPLWMGTWFRFDPPGLPGNTILQSMYFSERMIWNEPDYTLPPPKPVGDDHLRLIHDNVGFLQSRTEWANARMTLDGKIIAMTHPEIQIVYMRRNNIPTSFRPASQSQSRKSIGRRDNHLFADWAFQDPDGDTWVIGRKIEPLPGRTGFRITTAIQTSAPKDLLYLPIFQVFLPEDPASTPANSSQAIFPGLEYLGGLEPSSSEKDLTGPAAFRKLPSNRLVTWPMMNVTRNGVSLSMAWNWKDEPNPKLTPIFDSPDRIFGTGGHVMGLVFPRNGDLSRPTGSLLPYEPVRLEANELLRAETEITLQQAENVIPAIRDYARSNLLPDMPEESVPDFQEYLRTAAYGWLDSQCHSDEGYRHAVWMRRFGSTWARDIPIFIQWLADQMDELSTDPRTSDRLRSAAEEADIKSQSINYSLSAIGHVRGIWPLLASAPDDPELIPTISRVLRSRLAGFGDDHHVIVRTEAAHSPNARDLSETHFRKSTNGHTAQVIADCIELALLTGDRNSAGVALEHLDHLLLEGMQVPRGAQPWEVPLHTPDILASANLMRAMLLGYAATGDEKYLESAKDWAWSGVPFIYLRDPTPGSIGRYSTIPVFGATHYIAPVWIGQPVQWCGLVYAHYLYLLNEMAPDPVFRELADGITLAGMQHTWPLGDSEKAGLLPDYIELTPQLRDGPAINPGTLQINIPHLFNKQPFYSIRVLKETGITVMTGARIEIAENPDGKTTAIRVAPAATKDSLCLIHAHNSNDTSIRINDWISQNGVSASDMIFSSDSGGVIRVTAPIELSIP